MELEKELLTQMRYVLYTGRDLIEPLLAYEESEQSILSPSNLREDESVPAGAAPISVISTYQPGGVLAEPVPEQSLSPPTAHGGNTAPADLGKTEERDRAESGLENDRKMRERGEQPIEQWENAEESGQRGKQHTEDSDAQPPPLDLAKEPGTGGLPDAPEYGTIPHESMRDMMEGTETQDPAKPLQLVIDRSEVSMEVMDVRVSPLSHWPIPRQPEADLREPEWPLVPVSLSAVGNSSAIAPASVTEEKDHGRPVAEETQAVIPPLKDAEFPPIPSTEEGKSAPAEPEEKGRLTVDLATFEQEPQRPIAIDPRAVPISPQTLDSGEDPAPVVAETNTAAKPQLLDKSDEGSHADGEGLDDLQPAQLIEEKKAETAPFDQLPVVSTEPAKGEIVPESSENRGTDSHPPVLEDLATQSPPLAVAQESAIVDPLSQDLVEAKPVEMEPNTEVLLPAATEPVIVDPAIQDLLQPGPQLPPLSVMPPTGHIADEDPLEEGKFVEEKRAGDDYGAEEGKGDIGAHEPAAVAGEPQNASAVPEVDDGHSDEDLQHMEKSPPASHTGGLSDDRPIDPSGAQEKPEDLPAHSEEVKESQLPGAEGLADDQKVDSSELQAKPDELLAVSEEVREHSPLEALSRADEPTQDQKKDSSAMQNKPDALPAKSCEWEESQSPMPPADGRYEEKKVDISGVRTKPEESLAKGEEEAKESLPPMLLPSTEKVNEDQKVDTSGVSSRPEDLQAKKDTEMAESRESEDRPDPNQSSKDTEVLKLPSQPLQLDISGPGLTPRKEHEGGSIPHGEISPSGTESPLASDEQPQPSTESQKDGDEKEYSQQGVTPNSVPQHTTELRIPPVELIGPVPTADNIEVPESPHRHELAEIPLPLPESRGIPINEEAEKAEGRETESPFGQGKRPRSPLSPIVEAKVPIKSKELADTQSAAQPKIEHTGKKPGQADNKGNDEGTVPIGSDMPFEPILPMKQLKHSGTPPEQLGEDLGSSVPDAGKNREAVIAPLTVEVEKIQEAFPSSPIKPSDQPIPADMQGEDKLRKGEGERLEEAKKPETAVAPTLFHEQDQDQKPPSPNSSSHSQPLHDPESPANPQHLSPPPVTDSNAGPPQPPLGQVTLPAPAVPVVIIRAVGTAPGSDESRPYFRPMVTDSHKKLEQGNALTPFDTVPVIPHFPVEVPKPSPRTEKIVDALSKPRESEPKQEEVKGEKYSPEVAVSQSLALLPRRKDSGGKDGRLDGRKDTGDEHHGEGSHDPALHTNPARSPAAAAPDSIKLPPLSPRMRAEPANPQSPRPAKPNPLQAEPPPKAIPTGKLPSLHKESPTSTDNSKKPPSKQPQSLKSAPPTKPSDASRESQKAIPPSPITHKPTIEIQSNGLVFPGSSHYFDAEGEMILPRRNRYMDCFSDEDSPVQPRIPECPGPLQADSSPLDSATFPGFTQSSPKDPAGNPVRLDFDSLSHINPTSPRSHTKKHDLDRKTGSQGSGRSLGSSASEGHFLPPINSVLKIPISDAELSRDSKQFSSSDFDDSEQFNSLPHMSGVRPFLSAEKPDTRSMNLLQLPKAKGWSGSFSGRAMSGADPYNRFYSSARSSATYLTLTTPWTGQYHPLVPVAAMRKLRPKKRKIRTRSPPNPYEAGWNKRVLKQYFSLKLTVQPFTTVPTASVEKVDKPRTSSARPETKRKRKGHDVKE